MRRPRRRTVLAAVAVIVLAVVAVTISVAFNRPAHVSVSQQFVRVTPESDGAVVSVDTSLYEPASLPAPTILLAHGFGGTKASEDGQARSLARHGYQVLTWTARGFGRSGGLIHLDSRSFEVADASRLLDWVIARGGVAQSSSGAPLVGVAGSSYGGALALMLGATDHRVAAVAADITWNSLAQVLFPNSATGPGIASMPGTGPFKKLWAGFLFSLGQPTGVAAGTPPAVGAFPSAGSVSGSLGCGRFSAEFCQAYSTSARSGTLDPRFEDLLAQSSPSTFLAGMRAPVLLTQGEQDSLFGLDQADASVAQLRSAGAAVQLRWRSGGHDAPGVGDGLAGVQQAFFDDQLRSGRPTPTGRVYSRAAIPFELAQPDASISSQTGRSIAAQLRGRDGYTGVSASASADSPATGQQTFRLSGAAQQISVPPGGVPAAVSSLPSLGGLLDTAARAGAGSATLDPLPGQTAVFTTPALTQPLLLTGSSGVRLRFVADNAVTAFVSVRDVAADGTQTLPARLVAPISVPAASSSAPVSVDVQLPWIVDRVPAGHRLAVVVTTTDAGYSLPSAPQVVTVAVGSALTVPSTPVREIRSGTAGTWILVAVLVLVLCALALVLTLRRRRGAPDDPDTADVPVVISNLVKEYSDGYRAVDDVSFRVERGQVVGLLGPNGAGKTTTLRVLMGLITPTSGRVRVFGSEVVPGSPALADLGAFIEGPGFLPHLTGRENLQLYWAASGRPESAGHFDTVLEIAGLGSSLLRRVKTYSHGMQQRLAIAQAMLGLPEVLILDEPTNGLDPPQIAEMREVLRAYAETGRTVIVSSHLLAEVEQSCTHVVVMHKGRLVAAGSVAEVTGGTQRQLAVDDPAAAAELLREAGIDVETVPAQRALEDVFLDLIGEVR